MANPNPRRRSQRPIQKTTKAVDGDLSADAREALRLAAEIEELVDDLPDRTTAKNPTFFEGVKEKAADIAESVRRAKTATGGQIGALENMLAGVKKWDHGRRDDDD